MSDEKPDVPVDWADPFVDLPSNDDFDFDAMVGEPPEWYFPLVGRVAVATGGLERTAARAALHLLGWSETRGGELGFWISSSARLRTLLDAAKGISSEFDALAKELTKQAWESRNQIVHVATGWHDWESPDEPSGWHYENPRSGSRVYLDDPGTRPALERVLATIVDLDDRMWKQYLAMVEPVEPAAD